MRGPKSFYLEEYEEYLEHYGETLSYKLGCDLARKIKEEKVGDDEEKE